MSFDKSTQDKANSTYRWIIHTINDRPDPVKLIGYTKKEGMREAADKQQLLIGALGRLLGPTNRYLIDRAWHIEIFRRRPATVGLIEDKIADLYQEYYQLHGETQFDLLLIQFLEAYYKAVKEGTLDQLPPVVKVDSRQQEKADFSFSKSAYADRATLVAHCMDMLHRYPRERVTAYWLTYCKIHHPAWLDSQQHDGPEGSNQATPVAPPPPPPLPPAKQATEEAIDKLRNKFNTGRK